MEDFLIYRKGLPIKFAIQELERVKDTQLNGKIVDIFIKILKEENEYFEHELTET
ncbi:hypothetical protein [Petroclostridium xylanilyticum]|uniref:hypothetical protein n=1 Tax=Petroclostridium xylanilyticum TaxID=1792311 RepID=UPI0018E37534|nr:hypothetical protein [Petroclostridium xylanilyticum]